MNYEYLKSDDELVRFCAALSGVDRIGFDTEFVSEDRYYPQLCLVQVAAGGRYAIIDPLSIQDLTPFWQWLAEPGHVTIVHAGREEFRFCHRAIGTRPAGWFDTQLAAGLVGTEYPAAYGSLIQRLLGHRLAKGETRTDWRRRPLSERQLDYALQDVVHLDDLYRTIIEQVERRQRGDWLDDELEQWQAQQEADMAAQRWRRIAGISGLRPRQLAIARAIWKWRDQQARQRDLPAKRVLRDDLLVELARRGSADPKRIRAVRGMDWRKIQPLIPEIAAAIQAGLDVPDQDCPRSGRPADRPQFTLLGQFLATAVGSMARSQQVASSLVGSVDDVRQLIAWHLGYGDGQTPKLARGWRADVVGQVVSRLLDGELAIRIVNAESDQPLTLIPMQPGPGQPKRDAASADDETAS